MTTLSVAGRPKKSLADQLDRLDAILDGLSDSLGEAVADAVRAEVRAAVAEALTDPEVVARIRAAVTPPDGPPAVGQDGGPPARWAGVAEWLGRRWHGAREACGAAWRRLAGAAKERWGWVRHRWSALAAAVKAAWAVVWAARLPLLLALVLALGAGVLCYLGGLLVASLAAGAGAFGLAVLGLLLWSLWRTAPGVPGLAAPAPKEGEGDAGDRPAPPPRQAA